MSSTRPDIIERIDIGALLKSIGSLENLELRRTGLGPALQQVVDAAKALFKAEAGGNWAARPSWQVDRGRHD